MTKQVFIGLFTEGTTDERFLEPIIEKTFQEIILQESTIDVDIYLEIIKIDKGQKTFQMQAKEANQKGVYQFGMMIFCLHTDADSKSVEEVHARKIEPFLQSLSSESLHFCQNVIPVIPVQMTESWMLVDLDLLQEQIGFQIPSDKLGQYKHPERIANPKKTIKQIIALAQQHKSKRHRYQLTVTDLYFPIGQALEIEKLQQLTSFVRFETDVRSSLQKLNILR